MGNENILDALLGELHDKYPNITKYKGDIPQGFNRPCFYIQSMEAKQTEGLKFSAKRDYPFVIHYFPEKSNYKAREECRAIGDVLLDILEYLEFIPVPLRGYKMSLNLTEDVVLQCLVTYKLRYVREYECEYMQTLDVKEEIKNERD